MHSAAFGWMDMYMLSNLCDLLFHLSLLLTLAFFLDEPSIYVSVVLQCPPIALLSIFPFMSVHNSSMYVRYIY